MFFKLIVVLVAASIHVDAIALLERNLAYSSPFSGHPQLSHHLQSIQARHLRNVRRQNEDSSAFEDEHYPTFYGADFSNSPFVWNGGINFTHAVASGDPFDTSVLLWTRAVPASSGVIPDQSVPICVSFKISTSPNLAGKPVDSGEAFTSYDVDFTVKVEATKLRPDTKYFYQFADCTNPNVVSPIGTTRTLASLNTPANLVNGGRPLTLAVFSCSQYQSGYFNAYGVAAHNTTADIFLHLGDYIYESLGNGARIGRQTLGRELATIHDYRQRLNQYRTDVSLTFAHQHAPWITVWYDDHEVKSLSSSSDALVLAKLTARGSTKVADQAWKAGTANSNDSVIGCSFSASGACFTDRKLAAVRAYHEWMPIRQVDPDDKLRIWRNFQIGKLIDLTMLDTRQYNRDITDVYYNTVIESLSDFTNRSLMGFNQERWFLDTLTESKERGAIWRIVGQQIVFTQLNQEGSFDVDAWDGYRANRARVLDHLYKNKISNTVVLAGDSHANWVSDLAHPNDTTTYNPQTGAGAVGVEFAGTAVTSTSAFGSGIQPAAADEISRVLVAENADLQWSEGSFRGFFTLTVDPHRLIATFYGMQNISTPNLDGLVTAQFTVNNGANKLARPVAGGAVKAGVLKSMVSNTSGV